MRLCSKRISNEVMTLSVLAIKVISPLFSPWAAYSYQQSGPDRQAARPAKGWTDWLADKASVNLGLTPALGLWILNPLQIADALSVWPDSGAVWRRQETETACASRDRDVWPGGGTNGSRLECRTKRRRCRSGIVYQFYANRPARPGNFSLFAACYHVAGINS